MRDSSEIKKDIRDLEAELAEADATERHNQFLVLVHDELDACTDVIKLRQWMRENVVPHIYPTPKTPEGK